ncbi:hypothetical protein V6N13_068353 [Hibiscus sabdariffa]|uniref:Uncharacterized protein n=1 Tax=Hibiscus sabdariffa TaxID=183260 RepID=A0ABR2QMD2_9ROSI
MAPKAGATIFGSTSASACPFADSPTTALSSVKTEDYLQCLHQFQRRNRIYKEEQRKLRAAARKDKKGA